MHRPIKSTPHDQRVKALHKELSNLKVELQKSKGSFKRSTIQNEMRSVCRELARLENHF